MGRRGQGKYQSNLQAVTLPHTQTSSARAPEPQEQRSGPVVGVDSEESRTHRCPPRAQWRPPGGLAAWPRWPRTIGLSSPETTPVSRGCCWTAPGPCRSHEGSMAAWGCPLPGGPGEHGTAHTQHPAHITPHSTCQTTHGSNTLHRLHGMHCTGHMLYMTHYTEHTRPHAAITPYLIYTESYHLLYTCYKHTSQNMSDI